MSNKGYKGKVKKREEINEKKKIKKNENKKKYYKGRKGRSKETVYICRGEKKRHIKWYRIRKRGKRTGDN